MFNLEKAVNFLLNSQRSDGTYPNIQADPESSIYSLGVLYELDAAPKKETYNWANSLQTSKRGFAEAIGENSWDYTTYWGSEIHKFLGIKPKFEEEFVQFVNSHQNAGGGFGPFVGSDSTFASTIYWVTSLINLGYKPNNLEALENYLNIQLLNFTKMNFWEIYQTIYILKKLDLQVKNEDKIFQFIYDYYRKNRIQLDLESIFYIFFISELLDRKINLNILDFILKCRNNDGGFGLKPSYESNPKATYFAIKLLKINGFNFTLEIKSSTLDFVLKKENLNGGFFNENETSAHSNYCAVNSLKLLGFEPKYKDKLILWIKYCQNRDGGFGNYPNQPSIEKVTYWSVDTLYKLDSIDVINRENIIRYLDEKVKMVNPFNSYYILSICDLLDILPINYEFIAEELLKYQNPDDGFCGIKNTQSQMYEAFRATNSLYSLENILDKKKMKHYKWLDKIKESLKKWIMSCESKEGGFSWISDERSYIQPTYHALTVLKILDALPEDREKHINWICQFQNEDGGFNGGVNRTTSEIMFTFWALNSLNILTGENLYILQNQQFNDF